MNYDLYGQQILELWRNPINKGEIPDADFCAEAYNPFCGDRIKLFIKLKKTGKEHVIEVAKFSGQGCAISQASSCLVTEHLKGIPISKLKETNAFLVRKLLGVPISESREKCAFLILQPIQQFLTLK